MVRMSTLEYWRCLSASMKVPEKMLRPSRRPALSVSKFFSSRYDGQLSLANLQQQLNLEVNLGWPRGRQAVCVGGRNDIKGRAAQMAMRTVVPEVH